MLGSLGVFLFGMKLMSDGLQLVAGDRMKRLLGALTTNRFTAVLTGVGTTAIIQSSSATTVMVVSFVSAGLMTLFQGIGVIMGANIGTTMTAWLVSLLGFQMKVSAFALPAVGLGLPLTFLKGEKAKNWGHVLVGFGLLFLGLELLKDSIPATRAEDLAWIAPLTGHGFGSVLIFVGIGTVLTLLLQSSSATSTLTLTLAAMGWLPFDLAAAMVLGENIGTTITANLAALTGTRTAKQAALAHFLFNCIGVAWALVLFRVYLLPVVDWLVPGDPSADLNAIADPAARAVAAAAIPLHLAAFHTTFNVTNTCLLLPLARQFEALVRWILPDRPVASKEPAVRFLSPSLLESPELRLVHVRREMQHMNDAVRQMYGDAVRVLTGDGNGGGPTVEAVLEREEEVDRLEKEIVCHLADATRGTNSTSSTQEIAALLQNTHRLERISDHCAVLVRIARRLHDAGLRFGPEEARDLADLARLVEAALANLDRYLARESPGDVEELEREIDSRRRALRARHLERMEAGGASAPMEVAFLDAIGHLEEIGDRVAGIIRYGQEMKATRPAA